MRKEIIYFGPLVAMMIANIVQYLTIDSPYWIYFTIAFIFFFVWMIFNIIFRKKILS